MSAIQQVLLGAVGSGGAAAPSIALVQQKVGTTADGSSTMTVSLDTPVVGASQVIIACFSFLDTADFNGNPAFQSAPMTEAVTSTVTGVKSYIYWVLANEGGVDFTIRLDLPVRCSVNVSEWSGLDLAPAQDTSTATDTSTSLGVVPATQDPTSAQNLVIGIGGYVNAVDAYSSGPSNSFTRLTATGGASVFQECAYLIRAADHSAVTSVTTLGSSLAWAGCSASFGGV